MSAETVYSLRLPESLYRELRQLGLDSKQSVKEIVLAAIREYLKKCANGSTVQSGTLP